MSDALHDRIKGAVYGAAIGDALGSAFEFLDSARIERELGRPMALHYREALPGSLLYPREPGIPTDDTAMALALVQALAEEGPTEHSIARHFSTHLERGGTFGDLFWRGGPGGACMAMLSQLRAGAAPFEGVDPNAGGNGGAMRAYPCAVYRNRTHVAEVAALQTALSHGHPSAIAAAQVVALVVHEALYTATLPLAFPDEVQDDRMRSAWLRMRVGAKAGTRLPRHLLDVDMAGWNTVAAAHAIASLYPNDPQTAIGMAAASGKDTDTVASIVGAMLGSANGFSSLPQRWIDGLTVRDALDTATGQLYEIART